MIRSVIALILASAAGAASAQGPSATLPAWLAGMWHMEDGPAWTEEMWTEPRGGIMLGAGRSGAGRQLQSWESMRIVAKADGGISLIAQPMGGAPTEFAMASSGPESIEFANARHDYPQRVRYWRQGQLLMAEVAKIDGSNAQRWNYRPVAIGQEAR